MAGENRYQEERQLSQQTQQMFREQATSRKIPDRDKKIEMALDELLRNSERIHEDRHQAKSKPRTSPREKVETHHYAAPSKNNNHTYAESIHTGDTEEEPTPGDYASTAEKTVQDDVSAASITAHPDQTLLLGQRDDITLKLENRDEEEEWADDIRNNNTDLNMNGIDDWLEIEMEKDKENEEKASEQEEERKQRDEDVPSL